MISPRLRALPVAACMIALSVAVPGASASTPDLQVTMDDLTWGAVEASEIRNQGTAAVKPALMSNQAKDARAVGRRESPRGGYLRLPESTTSTGPQAILRLTPDRAKDTLLPVRRPFSFGADVRLLGPRGTQADQGNNVIQRGRYSGHQYKLQADRGVASCRIAGTRGATMVKDRQDGRVQLLDRSAWYRLSCRVERSSSDADVARLTLTVQPLEGGAPRVTRSSWKKVGAISPSRDAIDVGGVTPSSTGGNDQLEGDVDRLMISID